MNIKPSDSELRRIETDLKTLNTRIRTLKDLVEKAKDDLRQQSRKTVKELQSALAEVKGRYEQFKKADRTQVHEKRLEIDRACRDLHDTLEVVWNSVNEQRSVTS